MPIPNENYTFPDKSDCSHLFGEGIQNIVLPDDLRKRAKPDDFTQKPIVRMDSYHSKISNKQGETDEVPFDELAPNHPETVFSPQTDTFSFPTTSPTHPNPTLPQPIQSQTQQFTHEHNYEEE